MQFDGKQDHVVVAGAPENARRLDKAGFVYARHLIVDFDPGKNVAHGNKQYRVLENVDGTSGPVHVVEKFEDIFDEFA